jgi:WD40 repeat protein
MQTKPFKLLRSYKVQFSRTGSILVSLSRDVVVWDVERRAKRYRAHPFSHPMNCSVHPNETEIVVKNTAGTIALLDAQDGMLICFLDSAKGNEGSNIVYSSCGEYVVDGSWSGQLTVRSAKSGKVSFQKTFPGEMITKVIRSDHDGMWYIVHRPKAIARDLPSGPAYVSIWAWPFVSPGDFLRPLKANINGLAVSPDGRSIGFIEYESISIMDLAEKRFVASIPYQYGGTGFGMNWSPDSREFATVQENSLVFYDAFTFAKKKSIDLQFASDIAYSPNSSQIALGSWEAGLLIEHERT